ncbi:MAG: bifunctional demethylmenaquinone methyltransferase/2-methoxy-6-polyprenyl-1,4-benzoquinol methylase UbiE [Rikenellaceae bacterium]
MNKSKETIAAMFDEIAFKYDQLNHTLSLGIDKLWRKKVVKLVQKQNPSEILDIAAGTGDLSIALAKGIKTASVIGADISENMLDIARQKCLKLALSDRIMFENGNALDLKYSDKSFDAVTVAFGVRNFENLELGLSEMLRVTRDGGKVVIIELSMPESGVVRWFYKLYFMKILPTIGRLTSKSQFAYTYLPMSVAGFVCGNDFLSLMDKVGYKQCAMQKLSLGIATIYYGYK